MTCSAAVISTAARKAELRPVHGVSDPHSFATWLRDAAALLADIQDLYRYTDPTTTRIYAAPKLAKRRDAISRPRVMAAA